jgi:hypothetical protein
MNRSAGYAVIVGLGVVFWSALDYAGSSKHEPFDFLDRHTIGGIAAWLCAVFAVKTYESTKDQS